MKIVRMFMSSEKASCVIGVCFSQHLGGILCQKSILTSLTVCVCSRSWLWLLWLVVAAALPLAVRWLHVDSAGLLLTVPFTVDPLINTILGETWRHLENTQNTQT